MIQLFVQKLPFRLIAEMLNLAVGSIAYNFFNLQGIY